VISKNNDELNEMLDIKVSRVNYSVKITSNSKMPQQLHMQRCTLTIPAHYIMVVCCICLHSESD